MAVYDHMYTSVPISLSSYVQNLDLVSKSRYIDKLSINNDDGSVFFIPDPYNIKKEDWKNDAADWPKVTEQHIKSFLTDCPGQNFKSVSAFEYVVSGKVQDVWTFVPKNVDTITILSALVQPSMKSSNHPYKPWVVCAESGRIKAAHCTCVAGLGEVCSHIGALLYKVQLGVTIGISSAPTEKRCQWNNSFSKKVSSAPLRKVDLKKKKWNNIPNKKRKMATVPPTIIKPISAAEICELKSIIPNAVFFSSLTTGDEDDDISTDTASSVEKENEQRNVYENIISLYKRNSSDFSNTLKSYYKTSVILEIENLTRGQENEMWIHQRLGRITASNFGAVLKRKKKSKEFAFKIINNYKTLDVPSIRWGKDKEMVAFDAYERASGFHHNNLEVRKAGLFISCNDPYLAASPDGIVECSCCGRGVLEIKCPYKYRNEHPSAIAAKDRAFCLDANGHLKESHDYFAQVQGQMAISQCDYCDFVIWTMKDLFISRVRRDDYFWETNKDILKIFFLEQIIPVLQDLK